MVPCLTVRYSFFSQPGQRIRLTLLYGFLIVNKSHKKAKTNNVVVRLLILSDFATLSVALSPEPTGSY